MFNSNLSPDIANNDVQIICIFASNGKPLIGQCLLIMRSMCQYYYSFLLTRKIPSEMFSGHYSTALLMSVISGHDSGQSNKSTS